MAKTPEEQERIEGLGAAGEIVDCYTTAGMADSSQNKTRSLGFLLWIPIGLFAVLLFLSYLSNIIIYGWPPNWMERRTQRQQILERVQSAGGWTALKRDCDTLASAYKDGFTWSNGDTNSLPSAIAVLKPKEVVFYSRKNLQQFGSESSKWFGSNIVVRISIFGAHSTGGHDQPWLGLDVLCEPVGSGYRPERLRSTTPFKYWRYRNIADDIYEFY
jgi:hypothetical protein